MTLVMDNERGHATRQQLHEHEKTFYYLNNLVSFCDNIFERAKKSQNTKDIKKKTSTMWINKRTRLLELFI